MIDPLREVPGAGKGRFRRLASPFCLLGVLFSLATSSVAGLTVRGLNASHYDRIWLILFLGAFVLTAVLSQVRRGKVLIVAAPLALLLFVLIASVRSGAVFAVMVLVWVFVVSHMIGRALCRLIGCAAEGDRLTEAVFSTLAGLGVFAVLVFAFGCLGWLYPASIYALLTGLTVPVLVRIRRRSWHEVVSFRGAFIVGDDIRLEALIVGAGVVVAWLALLWALAPCIHYDALSYHLGVPARYVQEHRLVELPEEFRSYWAHNAEMLYTAGLLLAGQPVPSLFHFAFGALSASIAFCFARKFSGARGGGFAVAAFYSVPLVFWSAGLAYVDLVVAAFTAASIYAAALWWFFRQPNWLPLVGLFAGFAVGTKLNAALPLTPLALLIIVGVITRSGLSAQTTRSLVCVGIPAVFGIAPWLVRDWYWTGSPVFPFYNALFKSPKWPVRNTLFNFGSFGKGYGLSDLIRLPWDLVAHGESYVEALPAGTLGALPLLMLPWLLCCRHVKAHRVAVTLSIFLASVVLIWFQVGQFARYLMPVFPIAAVIAGLNLDTAWDSIQRSRWHRPLAILFTGLALCTLLAAVHVGVISGWPIPERYPFRVALGFESRDAFLSRSVRPYQAFQHLNRVARADTKVLSIGCEFRLYAKPRIFGVHGSREAGMGASAQLPPRQLADRLLSSGYEFLLIDQMQVAARVGMESLPVISETFTGHYCAPEFVGQNVSVYRIKKPGEPGGPECDDLIRNPGFEELASGTSEIQGWFTLGIPTIDRTGHRTHLGRVAVRIDGKNSLFQRVPITGGLYAVGHWTRADRAGQIARLQVNWLASDLRITDVAIRLVEVADQWSWHQMYITAPENARYADVYASTQSGSELWIDDVRFVRGTLTDPSKACHEE